MPSRLLLAGRALLPLVLAEPVAASGWWPFGSDDESQSGPKVTVREMRPNMLVGVPLAMEGAFGGFDPWEDLHKNMERIVHNNAIAKPGGPGAGGLHPVAFAGGGLPIELQLGNIFQAFAGHHAGQVGRAEGSFHVDDDHQSRVRITAQLPGYKLTESDLGGDENSSPLTVKVVGRRSVVVTGRQVMGPVVKTWQRTFELPRACNTSNVSVTFSAASGNLTVDVARRPPKEDGSEDVDENADEDEGADDIDDFLPPALRAMHRGLPGIIQQIGGPGGHPRGFLVQRDAGSMGMLPELLHSMGQLHPRNHAPHEKPVPEDVVVDLIGCFAEPQLAKAELKYYGESNAVSFASMYWHAKADDVPFFAMARHDQPMGHAFTFRGFAHEDETPQWGVYDGCGSRCDDDDTRWCGCSAEGSRHLPNHECPEGEKRFAVYKIVPQDVASATGDVDADGADGSSASGAAGAEEAAPSDVESAPAADAATSGKAAAADAVAGDSAVAVEPPGTDSAPAEEGRAQEQAGQSEQQPSQAGPQGQPEQQPEQQQQPAQEGRPYWQLTQGSGSDGPSIEIVVPKGQSAEVKGKRVLFYDAAEGAAAGRTVPADKAGTTAFASGATPLGKVKLPTGVLPDSCAWDESQTKNNGDKVMRCRLEQDEVKRVPIRVIDEL